MYFCFSLCAELRNESELTPAADTRHHIPCWANAFLKGISMAFISYIFLCMKVCVCARVCISQSKTDTHTHTHAHCNYLFASPISFCSSPFHYVIVSLLLNISVKSHAKLVSANQWS